MAAAPDGPRTVVYFVGPGGYGLSAAASPEVFLAAVEAAGFGQDGHLQSSADTFFMTGEPDDPHALAQRLSAELAASVIVWSTAVGPVGEYRSGAEVPGSRVEAPELSPSGDAEATPRRTRRARWSRRRERRR